MSDQELLGIYRKAWQLYYSPQHVETVLRRARSWGYDPRDMMTKLLLFQAVPRLEGLHPLEGGLFRRKARRDRRPGMPIEGRFRFYTRFAWDLLSKHARFARMYWQYRRILRRVLRDTRQHPDVAMAAVQVSDMQSLELFSATRGARIVVEKRQRRDAVRAQIAAAGRD
jgi:hypothetical protein